MATSGLQLLGFFLSLVGVAATVAATVMVEWKKTVQGNHRSYEGLWMSCGGVFSERMTCEIYHSFIKLPDEIQATRAALPISLFLSAMATIISVVGMKCTRFMDGMTETKSTTAMIGGIMFMVSGLLTVIITSWFVKTVVQKFYEVPGLIRSEFGNAVFVSWAGGFLTVVGGIFLSCRRCCGTKSSRSISSSHLLPTKDHKSNYV